MKYLLLGTIIGTHGLNGHIKFISSSYFLEERLLSGSAVYVGKDESHLQSMEVESFKYSPKNILLKLQQINTLEEAEKLKGQYLFVLKDDLQLEEDTYFFTDLEKCNVYDEDNNLLGQVIKVEEFPAQITLRVKGNNNKIFFVPFIEEFIILVNIESKSIIIKVIEGMLWKL